MKKVSIIGATIIGNRGAEAMLSTTVGRIKEKYPDSVFYIYSYYPVEDKKLIKYDNIIIHSATPMYLLFVLFPLSFLYRINKFLRFKFILTFFPSSIKDLSNSDVLIDLAGVSFMDGREIFLPFNILTIWPAILVKTPVVKFAQGLGPFNGFFNQMASKYFLPKCKQIFARGDKTYSFMNDFFKKERNFQLAGDVAFSYKQGDSLSVENIKYVEEISQELATIKTDKNIIGFCPSSVVYSKSKKSDIDYIDIFVQIIEKLLEDKNKYILLFPNATRERSMDKLRNNDLVIINKILEKISQKKSKRIIAINKDINTDSIKELISYCDITIVSRFHAMIASLSLCKPVIVLGWSHKYKEVMEQFTIEKYVIDYQDQDVNKLYLIIMDVFKNKEKIEKLIFASLPAVQKESFKEFEYLFNKVLV